MRKHMWIALFCLAGLIVIGCQDKSEKATEKKTAGGMTMTERQAAMEQAAKDSATNLNDMMMAIYFYQGRNDDRFPPNLEALDYDNPTESRSMFNNPRNLGAKPDYVYIYPHDETLTENILVYENYVTWPELGLYYLIVDMRVQHTVHEAAFKKLLAESQSE